MPKVSSNCQSREHRRPSNEPNRRFHKDISRVGLHKNTPTPRKVPKDSLGFEMSGDDDYIRNWLAQIQNDTNQDNSLVTGEATSKLERSGTTHVELLSSRAAHRAADISRPSKRQKGHSSLSSDSSVLKVRARSNSHPSKPDKPRDALLEQPESQPTRPRKKQRITSSNTSLSNHSATANLHKQIFEKRPRHKTREDKYDPTARKEKKSKKVREEASSRKKRKRRGESKKASNSAGDQLIQNFSSKNITQDRLTIRPANGLGLFNNGRASSPARRRGLPDLAFSEMEFLQHSKPHPHNEKENTVRSRSREKERRKASRAQDEISTFFRPMRPSLQAVSSNRSASSHDAVQQELESCDKEPDVEQGRKVDKFSHPLDLEYEPRKSLGVTGPFSDKYQVSHGNHGSPKFYHFISPLKSTRGLSDKATTYVSWSESERSPVSTSRHDRFDQSNISRTPDSVRRSIEETGIFRGTGIRRAMATDLKQANESQNIRECQKSKSEEPLRREESTKRSSIQSTSYSDLGADKVDHLHQERDSALLEVARSNDQFHLPERQRAIDHQNQRNVTFSQQGTSQKLTAIEHFYPANGRREDPNTFGNSKVLSTSDMRANDSHMSKPITLTREEIARNVRVKVPKRPSTTVPVLRDASNEIHHTAGSDEDRGVCPIMLDREPPIRNHVQSATSSKMLLNLVQRPSLSRVSNPSFPTIYEDSYEQFASHGEVSLLEKQSKPEIAPRRTYSRLNREWLNDNSNQFEGQLEQQVQAHFPAQQESNQQDHFTSNNVAYLGFPATGAWLGTSPSSLSVGKTSLPRGGQSLFIRQMQRSQPLYHIGYDESNSSVDAMAWRQPCVAPPTFDEGYNRYQHNNVEFAEDAAGVNYSNTGHNQTYHQGLDHVSEHYHNDESSLDVEAPCIDQGFDRIEGQDHNYHQDENIGSEQYSALFPKSYDGTQYGENELHPANHQLEFWQPNHF